MKTKTKKSKPTKSSSVYSAKEIKEYMKSLPGWQADQKSTVIMKEFPFPRFSDGIKFVTKVAVLADKEMHHPDIHILYTTVLLVLSTHDAGGVTKKDILLASKIDTIAERLSL